MTKLRLMDKREEAGPDWPIKNIQHQEEVTGELHTQNDYLPTSTYDEILLKYTRARISWSSSITAQSLTYYFI